jgi:GT2 family glycosyltransferase
MTRVSVVIVSHNRVAELRRSLEILKTAEPEAAPVAEGEEPVRELQVIVVDNGSTDGSAALEAEFPAVRFIRLPKNFGLTKAMNLGLRSAEGEHVLFLHDDTRIPASAVAELARVLESQPEVGIVAPLLVDEYGKPVPQVRDLPSPERPFPEWRAIEGHADEDAPSVSGAALMVRSFFLKAMRNIDEHYGNYGSDADICAQAVKRAGKKIRVIQAARAIHAPNRADSPLLAADREIGTIVFLGKFCGFWAGLKYRLSRTVGAVLTFRWGVAKFLLSNQKVDGAQ